MTRARSALAAVLVLAACAQAPERPEPSPPAPPAPPADTAISRAFERHRALAEQYRKAGDLQHALLQSQAAALLDPDDARAAEAVRETRATIGRTVAEQLAQGREALRSGEPDRASAAMLKVLAADPDNAEAAQALRDIERQRASRTQAERAARVRNGAAAASRNAPNGRSADAIDAYDLEQRIEMFRAGDVSGGLRELQRFVDAHPGDRAGRAQIGAAVYERGREAEAHGGREEALVLYDQAIALRGERVAEWSARAERLRRSLGNEYYEKGLQSYRSDPTLAIRMWETSLRFDPKNARAAAKLAEARRDGKGNGR